MKFMHRFRSNRIIKRAMRDIQSRIYTGNLILCNLSAFYVNRILFHTFNLNLLGARVKFNYLNNKF